MTLFADLVVRSSVLLLVGLAAAACLRRQSAALRHAVVAAAVFTAALSVPLTLMGPSWEVQVPAVASRGAPSQAVAGDAVAGRLTPEQPVAAAPRPGSRVAPLLATIWTAGWLLCAVWLAAGVIRIARITARARPVRERRWRDAARDVARAYGLRRPIALLHVDRPHVLATWGLRRPSVLLPGDADGWSDARIRAVLSHELAHIRRQDWLVQIAAEALRTLVWFNPLMWIACGWLRRESERAADDAVLRLGVPPRDYAAELVAIAKTCRRAGPHWAPAMTMARPSTLEGRISAMLNGKTDRTPLSRRALVMTASLMFVVALPVAALRTGQSAPLPLTGTVFDATGAVMPGVGLTLEGARQVKWQTTTGSDGRFEFPPIAAGRYALEVSIAGFGRLREEIALTRQQDWDRAITLQVGTVSEQIIVSASRAAAPAGSTTPGTPLRVRVGGNVKAPLKVAHTSPVYPESMRQAGREGDVPIEAVIGTDGGVHAARVLGAHVHPDFAAAALDAVRQWRFTPTLLNGAPVEIQMVVTVKFSLAD